MEEDIEFIRDKLVCEANYHNKDSCINCDYDDCQVKKFERIVNELKKKDKIIDLMTECISNLGWSDLDSNEYIKKHFEKEVKKWENLNK